jgi:hypothetical protein
MEMAGLRKSGTSLSKATLQAAKMKAAIKVAGRMMVSGSLSIAMQG